MPISYLNINKCIKKNPGFIKTNILMQLNPNHPTNQLSIWVQTMVTNAISYDVLIKGVVLYPIGFVLDFWEEIASYILGGNHAMGFKLNSLSNIFHRVLDQSVVLSCWLDLLAHYLGD
jgi:hypothetical protein